MEAVKIARTTLNLTQEEFAQMLGISRNYLAQIETGRCKCPKKIKMQIDAIMARNQEASLDHWKQRALVAEAKLSSLKDAMMQVLNRY